MSIPKPSKPFKFIAVIARGALFYAFTETGDIWRFDTIKFEWLLYSEGPLV